MGEFVPNKNATESSKLDQRSIRFIKNLLPDDDVDCSQLHEGGTLPNIDGYLDFLCKDGTANERIFVQVKHLTYAPVNGVRFMVSLNQFTHIRSGIRAKSLFLLLVTPKVKSSIGDI